MKNRFNMINRNWKYMINSGCTVIRFNMIKSKLDIYDLLLWVFWWIEMYDSETVSEIRMEKFCNTDCSSKFFSKGAAGPPLGGENPPWTPRRCARWS